MKDLAKKVTQISFLASTLRDQVLRADDPSYTAPTEEWIFSQVSAIQELSDSLRYELNPRQEWQLCYKTEEIKVTIPALTTKLEVANIVAVALARELAVDLTFLESEELLDSMIITEEGLHEVAVNDLHLYPLF